MPKRRTHEEFVELLNGVNPDISVIGNYVNSTTKIKVINNVCNHSWSSEPSSLLRGTNCPICFGSQKKSQQQFEDEVRAVNADIKVLGKYDGIDKKITCKCLKDGYEWAAVPANLLRGHGCPVCDNKVVLKGVNDLATTNPDILKFIKNIDDAYRYSRGSHLKIDFICPDCGNIRNLTIKNVVSQGFTCTVCGDKISYPNKFARNLLKQLNVCNLCHEYKPEWAGKYRYDNYFEFGKRKYILEMDGDFHFKNNKMNRQTVEISRQIDHLKDELARDNGVEVIRIDCRKSDLYYIKENIEKSKLNYLFDLNNVDWIECSRYAASNFIKEVCLYYQANKESMSRSDVSKHFSINVATLYNYLKIGEDIGWVKNDIEKTILNSLHCDNPKSKRVLVLDIESGKTLYEFKSMCLCEKMLRRLTGYIYNRCSISYAIKHKNGFYKNYIFKYG